MTNEGGKYDEPVRPSRISEEFRSREFLHEDVRHIAIEGVIGAGKTTLASKLASKLDARLVLEQFEENPFLERFYADPDRWAFQTQLAFLASRFQQQANLVHRDLFQQLVVADYTFAKDRIFATVTLEGDELQLYEALHRSMARSTASPDLIIFLRASVEKLLENIEKRGRPYETYITPDYLNELADAYDYYFFRYNRSPVVIVNMEEVDFVEDPNAVVELIRQIGSAKYQGTIYFRAVRPDLFDE